MVRKLSTSGFTLVETIVVVGIIGILASVALFTFGDAREQARDNTRINDLQQIRLALETYKADHGHYPFETDGYSGGDSGAICTDPDVCSSARLNEPINEYLATVMGTGVRDPRHNEGGGTQYWYYYDGRKNCNSDYYVVTLHARTMETETYRNVDELVGRCPEFNNNANEGGGLTQGTAHVIIMEYLDRSTGSPGEDW